MQVSSNRRVLIAGAGIAGPTLAYWLARYGFIPTLVEIAPALRTGGYMIDFWGAGYDVAERMGLVLKLKRDGYRMTELRLVDDCGRRVGGFDTSAYEKALRGRFFSILRSDLAHELFRTVENDVEVIFGDSIARIEQDAEAANVTFRSGAARTFDLVIGADGLHSGVRGLIFGEEKLFEKFLGYYAASFIVPDYPHRTEGTYLAHTAPGRQIARYALRGNRTAFFFVFASDLKRDLRHRDVGAQKEILHDVFHDDVWEIGKILAAMGSTDELYFDAVSQIHLPTWSRGRVALIGDAACCPSLLAGQGAAFAMAAAYLLSGELKRSGGDHAAAFGNFDRLFRPYITGKQRAAASFARWFAPKTKLGLAVRNIATRLMAVPLIGNRMLGSMLNDRLTLPDYEN